MIPIYIVLFVSLLRGYLCEILRGKDGFGADMQDWGYVQVRDSAHMFWWLHYTAPPVVPMNYSSMERPLLIWLQGGPCLSGTGYGYFEEFGPIDSDLKLRNYSWIDDYNVLLLDSPVGTGFSYVEKFQFAMDQAMIVKDIFTCIGAIFEKIPDLKKMPTYIVGEAYGGKVAVDVAWYWYQAEQNKDIDSKLLGIALGNPLIDPLQSILSWPRYLINMGFIDSIQYDELERLVRQVKELLERQEFYQALELQIEIEDMINKYTSNINIYNVLQANPPFYHDDIQENTKLKKLMNGPVKEALHLDPKREWIEINSEAQNVLKADRMTDSTFNLERLLNDTHLKVVIYSGQFDMLAPTAGIIIVLDALRWSGTLDWYTTPKLPLVINDIVEGYKKSHDKLTMYWINRAGQMAPRDNPDAVSEILTQLTETHTIHQYQYRT